MLKEMFSVNGQFYEWIRPQAPASRAEDSVGIHILLSPSHHWWGTPSSGVWPHRPPTPCKQTVTASWWETTELNLSLAFSLFPASSLRGSGLNRLNRLRGSGLPQVSWECLHCPQRSPQKLTTLTFTGHLQFIEQDKERPINQLQYVDLIWTLILTNYKQTKTL